MDAIGPNTPNRPRLGFTLVEMLVVIVIIGILAGLVTGAAMGVRARARVAAVVAEISQLDMALNAYKEKYGEYPPDFTDESAVTRHIARAFPRYSGNWKMDLAAAGLDLTKLDPISALVFWLGGMPEPVDINGDGVVDAVKMTGFNADQRHPFFRNEDINHNGQLDGAEDVHKNGLLDGTNRTTPLYEFKPDQLKYVAGRLMYFPPYPEADTSLVKSKPLVYFRAGDQGYLHIHAINNAGMGKSPWLSALNSPQVMPYWDTRTNDWVDPQKYQIISAGFDGKFGQTVDTKPIYPLPYPVALPFPPCFPTGENYSSDPNLRDKLGHHDNITNFSGGKLEDKMP